MINLFLALSHMKKKRTEEPNKNNELKKPKVIKD